MLGLNLKDLHEYAFISPAAVSLSVYALTELSPIVPLYHSSIRIKGLCDIHYWSGKGVMALPLYQTDNVVRHTMRLTRNNDNQSFCGCSMLGDSEKPKKKIDVSLQHLRLIDEVDLDNPNRLTPYDIIAAAFGASKKAGFSKECKSIIIFTNYSLLPF